MRYSTKIKDEEGYPAFALVNQVTGQALKHSLGQSHPVSYTTIYLKCWPCMKNRNKHQMTYFPFIGIR
jgi:hypothetical protein